MVISRPIARMTNCISRTSRLWVMKSPIETRSAMTRGSRFAARRSLMAFSAALSSALGGVGITPRASAIIPSAPMW